MWMDYLDWRDRFAAAMDPRFYPISYLDSLILDGSAHVWATPDAAIVAEIKDFPSGLRAVHGLMAAGDREIIVNELIPLAEAWGREKHCEVALIDSREGWGRVMKEYGYAPFQAAIVKDL